MLGSWDVSSDGPRSKNYEILDKITRARAFLYVGRIYTEHILIYSVTRTSVVAHIPY